MAFALDEPILDFMFVLAANAVGDDAVFELNVPYGGDEDEAARVVHDWASVDTPGGLRDLIREWEREVERVIGSRPWWRRVFRR
jgi:hypothetical protein